MRAYLELARPHHWVKNLLILLPLVFSGRLGEWPLTGQALAAFVSFSLAASAIYCVNDVRDAEKDRRNPAKQHRPVAAGRVSPRGALGFCGLLLALAVLSGIPAAGSRPMGWLWLGLYLLLNLGYSLGLKDLPLVDVAILASGYLLRILYGGAITGIELSKWLCLTVIAMSFYLGLGKRRGELMSGTGSRAVLRYYSERFLGYNMYMCVALAVLFYALWTVDPLTVARAGGEGLVWTVPLVLLICMLRHGQARRR